MVYIVSKNSPYQVLLAGGGGWYKGGRRVVLRGMDTVGSDEIPARPGRDIVSQLWGQTSLGAQREAEGYYITGPN